MGRPEGVEEVAPAADAFEGEVPDAVRELNRRRPSSLGDVFVEGREAQDPPNEDITGGRGREELNPHAIDVVDKATESVQFFSDCVRRGDFESFVEDFRSTSEFMGDFCAEAQILSKTLIRHLP